MPLTHVNPVLAAVGPSEGTFIEVIVDSGACETVMPRELCQRIPRVPSTQSLAKMEYEVASGKSIPHLGGRKCEVYAEGYASSLLMNFQVADVHRPLLSLSKAADMGFRSYFYVDGGWLEDMETGEVFEIERKATSIYCNYGSGESSQRPRITARLLSGEDGERMRPQSHKTKQ